MNASQFQFLSIEWPDLHEAACKAEGLAMGDPRAACFYARRALELAMHWLYKYDAKLKLPYQDNLSALIHEPSFKAVAGETILNKARVLQRQGNDAVHSHRPVRQLDAQTVVRELFHLCFWLARTYARGPKPTDTLVFDPALLPAPGAVSRQTMEQLQRLEAQLRERDEKLAILLADKEALDTELERLRAEVADAKQANQTKPDVHDYSEAETRDYFIDLLLKEAGWALDQPRDREFEVSGMPGQGFVDYVLWGDDGKPLGLLEAKRARKSPEAGQQQAKLYADCLEKLYGRRPVIFYSNGYEHWVWDDVTHAPRQVHGFYKKAELELLIQRRTSRKKLGEANIDSSIVERYYQTRAIRRISEAFERDHLRKALVVMATGAGKTRTVIALCDVLMRCNWAKRVLFLADRVALVRQAVEAFKKHLPDSAPVNLVTEREQEGRVFVSTYPTMMGLINEAREGERRFGAGHFDLVIVDEAHRSIYQKYGAIFDYFDSLLVGLTATPKDEIDFNTYGLFDLERGVPTDAYTLENAVGDGYLVPSRAVSVPLKYQREGIKYDDLSEDEKEEWDAKEWNNEGEVPERVEAEAVSKWLFNKDTVDKVLEHLMIRGQKVAGGDRLGKTIIFAKNQAHAKFIAERFDANYPEYKGEFARIIHCDVSYAQSLIDSFSHPAKAPHIAVSVDMLDTGIDVPEVVNLVFFKLVHSKTKFWQMIGRGTRLSPDLFGPGQHKAFFYVFDYCQNLEYFSQDPETTEGSIGASLRARLFQRRLDLIVGLDSIEIVEETRVRETPASEIHHLRTETARLLQEEVAGMNLENFIVRPQRRLVEKYTVVDPWKKLSVQEAGELAQSVAGLPTKIESDDEEAKRFDLLMLNLQLTQLRSEPGYTRLRDQVKGIAGLLEEKGAIPMVQQQMILIQELQTDEWWQDVTLPMLERVRNRLRLLVKLIDKQKRKPIYTDFEDTMGDEQAVELPGFASPDSYERFRAKARQFLKAHDDHIAVHKLKANEPLTPTDLAELERMLTESAIGRSEDLDKAKRESNGLGLFVRSLVGLDRQAAKDALGAFLTLGSLQSAQIEFVNEIVNHLTEHGLMEAARLYESPFTNFHSQGVEGIFSSAQVDTLISILDEVRVRAAG